MGYESYLRKRRYRSQVGATNRSETSSFVALVSSPSRQFVRIFDVFSFIYRFFTGLSLRLRAEISKVTAHERIQHLYHGLRFTQSNFCV
jgi:hypothetical protein